LDKRTVSEMEDTTLSNHLNSDPKAQYEQHPYQVNQDPSVQSLGQHHIPMGAHLQTLAESEVHMPMHLDYRHIADLRNHLEERGVSMSQMDSHLQHQIDSVAHHMNSQMHHPDLDNPLNIAAAAAAKKRRHEKDSQLNVCLALGCDRQIKQRRLCPMHQKQKERNGGKLDLKEHTRFSKGRTPTPFSRHANKYAKLKAFDKKIDEWAGGREEGSMMLEAYLDSNYHQTRFARGDDNKIFESIGRNIVEFMKQLPEKSPLRRPLIKAMSENVPLARLRDVLPVSKQTVLNSKKLSDQDNLLLTIKYKPNVTRSRKRGDGLDMQGNDESIVTALMGSDDLAYSGHAGAHHLLASNTSHHLTPLSLSNANLGVSLPSFNMGIGNPKNTMTN